MRRHRRSRPARRGADRLAGILASTLAVLNARTWSALARLTIL